MDIWYCKKCKCAHTEERPGDCEQPTINHLASLRNGAKGKSKMLQPHLDLLVIASELRKSDEPIYEKSKKALAAEISRLVNEAAQLRVNSERSNTCPVCRGSKCEPNTFGIDECSNCDGTGQV